MMLWEVAGTDDLHAVMSDLSDISALEAVPDGATWWNALAAARKLLLDPAGKTVVLRREGTLNPLAIFGHHPNGYGLRTTWFLMSSEFEVYGAAATRACRNYLKTLQNLYPGTTFHSYTLSRHPQCARWFTLLGFQFDARTTDGSQHFVLRPRTKNDLAGNG